MEEYRRKAQSRGKRGEKMKEETIWYLCDGVKKDCKKRYCYKNTEKDPCRHTKDINHAVNFKKVPCGNHAVYEEMDNQEDWIEKQNKKIEHWLWIIFVSIITSIITTILATM